MPTTSRSSSVGRHNPCFWPEVRSPRSDSRKVLRGDLEVPRAGPRCACGRGQSCDQIGLSPAQARRPRHRFLTWYAHVLPRRPHGAGTLDLIIANPAASILYTESLQVPAEVRLIKLTFRGFARPSDTGRSSAPCRRAMPPHDSTADTFVLRFDAQSQYVFVVLARCCSRRGWCSLISRVLDQQRFFLVDSDYGSTLPASFNRKRHLVPGIAIELLRTRRAGMLVACRR